MSMDPGLQEQLRQEKVGATVMGARRALRRGEKDTAKRELQKALKLDVNDCGALELLGEFYMAEGEQEKAIEVMEKGHKLYPNHTEFEKNIALCVLDLEEMKQGNARQGMAADDTQLLERKPIIAVLLSVVPGAGQWYNGDIVAGGMIFGIWAVSLLGWYFPLMNAMKQLPRNTPHSWANALAQMAPLMRGWFWLAVAICVGATVYALVDASVGATRANSRQHFEPGIL